MAVTSSLQDLRYKAPSRAVLLQMQFICTLITDRIAKMFATKKTTNLVKLMNQVREVGQFYAPAITKKVKNPSKDGPVCETVTL